MEREEISLSPFPFSFSIFSFSLHFLILSPFPLSPAARLPEVVTACDVYCFYLLRDSLIHINLYIFRKRKGNCVELGKPQQNPEGGSLLPADDMAYNMMTLSMKIQRI